mmetsp:Transcript_51582/g.136262  ORF Transcript_51582/g.136262 Transcript_51582/m.136262 type:complete len:337 (-) Transcript_51582:45-1055(-)
MLVGPRRRSAALLSCLVWWGLAVQRPCLLTPAGLRWASPVGLPATGPRRRCARARAVGSSAAGPYPGCPESLDIPAPLPANPKWHARHHARAEAARERALAEDGQGRGQETADSEFNSERYERYRRWKAAQVQEELASFRARTRDAPTMCIDCEWEGAMADRELNALVRTLMRCYGSNRKAERPFRLALSGIAPGSRMEVALRRHANYEHWAPWIRISAEPYIELFRPSSRLVYLSPDGEGVVDRLEGEQTVFVLGALSDSKRRLTGLTREKADAQGIASARLPIQEHLGLRGGNAVLVASHVLDITLARRSGLAWEDALRAHIPQHTLQRSDRNL